MAIVLNTPNQSFQNDADIIEPNIVVFASSANNTVTNNAVLWTTEDGQDAIDFNANSSNATVTNSSAGYVRGGRAALNFDGDGATISNAGVMIGDIYGLYVAPTGPSAVVVNNVFGGTIKGVIGVRFGGGGASEINNDGIVYGGNTGVHLFAGKLTNSGEIGGNALGVVADTGNVATIVNTDFGGIWSTGTAIAVSSGLAAIINDADCLITGSEAAITTADTVSVSSSRILLTNLGKIDGKIDCNAESGDVNDIIVNKGKINGDVLLGAGADFFNGTGGTSGKVFGEDGSDTLIGGFADDKLDGGAGNDLITGGRGKDVLFGGTEADIYDFNSIKESVRGTKRDTIEDFQRGSDKIDLFDIDAKTGGGNQKFKFIGKQGFHDQKGELRYKDLGNKVIVQGDVNGDGKADFEIYVAVGALSKGDFLL